MKLVSAALKEKGIAQTELSPALQQEVTSLQEMIVKYNKACETYEAEEGTNKETEAKLNEQEDYLLKIEEELAGKIKSYEVPAPPPTPPTPAELEAKKKEEDAAAAAAADKNKDKDGFGWVIFTVIAGVLTFGAVKLLKKK